ncbi:MAG: TIGR04282 family arsenosugar biosynthesis glycosyltransferase [Burkholderiales bacterium]
MRSRAEASVVIIVFAKAPLPGRVKTRLAPLIGSQGAARLQARLIRRALDTARAADCGDVELCCAPHRKYAFFERCGRLPGISLTAQGGGDLGARMHRALARGLRTHRAAILIGADCPALRPGDLRIAARALCDGVDAVFAPTEDGGYALVGASRMSKRLFERVAWGTGSVMRETQRRLRTLGWHWRMLRRVWDVDRPEDYVRLMRSRLLLRSP